MGPQLKSIRKPLLTGIACLICFLIGVVFTTGAGEYWLTLFDAYGAFGLSLIALIEIMSTMYVYGHKNFTNDIHQMTGVRPGLYWQLTWRLIAPALITILVITSVINQFKEHPKYDAYRVEIATHVKVPYPGWTLTIGGFLAIASFIPIGFVACSRRFGFSSPHANYEAGSPLKRIDTNASNNPMIHDYQDEIRSESDESEDNDAIIVAKDNTNALQLPKPASGILIDTSTT